MKCRKYHVKQCYVTESCRQPLYIYIYTLSIWGYFGSIYYVPTGCMFNYPTPHAFLFSTPTQIWPLVAFGWGLDRFFLQPPAH